MDNAMGGVTGRIILMHKRMATHAMYVRLCRGSLPRSRGSSASVRRVAPIIGLVPSVGLFVAATIAEPIVNIVKTPSAILHVRDMGRLVTHWGQTYTCMLLIRLVCIMHIILGQQRMLLPDMCTAGNRNIIYTDQPDMEWRGV